MKKRLAPVVATLACLPVVAGAAESDLSEVIVVTPDPQASEAGSDPALLYIARNGGKLDVPLTVSFTLTGSATNGTDYRNVPLTLTLPPNDPMGIVTISPLPDASAEGNETVVLTLVPKPGTYTLGKDRTATATIADATSSAKPPARPGTPPTSGGPTSTPSGAGTGGTAQTPADGAGHDTAPDLDASRRLPPPDKTGSMTITVAFHAAGKWVSKTTPGVYSNLKWQRSYSYTVPLRGMFSPGSQFQEIDRQQKGGFFVPNFKRYFVFKPRDFFGPAGRVCGRGESRIQDEEVGVTVGDPGMPPLVPFTRIKQGGGVFPSGDKTVPERDLCFSDFTLDTEKNVFHLRIDGSDAHVKVRTIVNGKEMARPHNVQLQGDDPNAKSKLLFLDVPVPKGSTNGIEGQRVIENFSTVRGPENSIFPMSARVSWKVSWK